VRAAGAVLLDVSPDPALSAKIAARLEQGGDRISDLHLWRVGPGHMAAIVSMVSDHPETSSSYKKRLSETCRAFLTLRSRLSAALASPASKQSETLPVFC
jgi:Co/Zn/Cd efflux system component